MYYLPQPTKVPTFALNLSAAANLWDRISSEYNLRKLDTYFKIGESVASHARSGATQYFDPSARGREGDV